MPCSLPEGKECKLKYTINCSHDVINGRLRVRNFIVAGLSDFDFDGSAEKIAIFLFFSLFSLMTLKVCRKLY